MTGLTTGVFAGGHAAWEAGPPHFAHTTLSANDGNIVRKLRHVHQTLVPTRWVEALGDQPCNAELAHVAERHRRAGRGAWAHRVSAGTIQARRFLSLQPNPRLLRCQQFFEPCSLLRSAGGEYIVRSMSIRIR